MMHGVTLVKKPVHPKPKLMGFGLNNLYQANLILNAPPHVGL